MKTKLFFAFFMVVILTNQSYGQFAFGVSPGNEFKSAYLGYKVHAKIVPYIGLQYLNANFKMEQIDIVEDATTNTEISGSLIIPNIGFKYFLKQKNKLQPFFSFKLSKPMVRSGKFKVGEDNEFLNNAKDVIKNMGMWGAELGFGIEYFLDENFSVGGEYGLRYLRLHMKNDQPISDNFFDISANMNRTFSRISINFYF